MQITLKRLSLALTSAGLLTLYGCGGGGGGSAAGSPAAVTPAAAAQIIGTAATGAALANAPVTITNSTGASACVEASLSTADMGSYTCTLKSGEAAPFFIVVTDPTGQQAPLVSIAAQTPVAGTSITVNATSLTTAIVAQLNANSDPLAVVTSRTYVAADLTAATTNVLAQLAPVLSAIGTPADYNPFTTSITAATATSTGNPADQVLDTLKIGTDPSTGKPALSTVTDPTPVVLATAKTPGSKVAAPTSNAADLSRAAQLAAQTFTKCFALPTAQRVLASDTTITAANGGPAVTNVADACLNIVSVVKPVPAFNHNGYNAGQFFYDVLTNAAMTNAKFSVPEVIAFYPANANNPFDRAVLNIRYIDNAGNPGNVITVAANVPGTATTSRPSNWWLVGNQHPADVGVKLNVRRVEQFNPTTKTGSASTFQTGIQFVINTQGPGSVVGGQTLSLARISGPGLPTNGLVYTAPSANTPSQSIMDLWNKTGSLSVGARCGNTNGTSYNCPNFWLARSAGISGTSASTPTTNPVDGAAPSFKTWAQPSDGSDAAKFVKGATYQVELFYGSSSIATYIFNKTLLSDMVPATQAVNLPWNTLGTTSLAALDPSNTSLAGQQANSLNVDWVQNPAAQQIDGIQVVDTTGSYASMFTVSKGATSAVLTNAVVPAFSTTTTRSLLFRYRMLDGSNKTAVYTYN
jgi:hypothetical protein